MKTMPATHAARPDPLKGPRLAAAPVDEPGMAAAKALLASLQSGQSASDLHGLTLVSVRVALGGSVQHWRLGNGLEIVLAPDAASNIIAYHTWVKVGSAHEEEGRTGLAHLLEHLMFKASKNFRAGAFDRELERLGASPNAATWLDWTMYHETVPAEGLERVVALESDRLTGLKLSEAAFRSELQVVRAERREVVDTDPEGRLEEAFAEAVFGTGVGYGHATVGRASDLEALTLQDVLGFYRRYYAPATTVLVLAGAVDPGRDLPRLCRAYGPLQGDPTEKAAAAAVRARPAAAPLASDRKLEVRLDAGADRLFVGWRALPGDHIDQPLLVLWSECVGNATAARLERALVDDARLAVEVDVAVPALARGGVLELRVGLRPGVRAEVALQRLDRELEALRGKQPLTDADIDAARNRLRASRLQGLVTADGRAEALGHDAAAFGEPTVGEAWWRRLESATRDDVERVGHGVLAGPRVVLVGRARTGRGRGQGAEPRAAQ